MNRSSPQTPGQFPRHLHALETHDALLGGTVAEQIDAAKPDDILVDHGKFLMDANTGWKLR